MNKKQWKERALAAEAQQIDLRALAADVPRLLKADPYGFSKKHRVWVDSVQRALLGLADVLDGSEPSGNGYPQQCESTRAHGGHGLCPGIKAHPDTMIGQVKKGATS